MTYWLGVLGGEGAHKYYCLGLQKYYLRHCMEGRGHEAIQKNTWRYHCDVVDQCNWKPTEHVMEKFKLDLEISNEISKVPTLLIQMRSIRMLTKWFTVLLFLTYCIECKLFPWRRFNLETNIDKLIWLLNERSTTLLMVVVR